MVEIRPEKKYCPMCFYTAKTKDTHCPKVGEYPRVHDYRLSVRLEICKPDKTNEHKYARSAHREPCKPDMQRVARMIAEQRLKQGEYRPPIDLIRFMQKRARRKGIIKDSAFD